jgi:hypothetical protein
VRLKQRVLFVWRLTSYPLVLFAAALQQWFQGWLSWQFFGHGPANALVFWRCWRFFMIRWKCCPKQIGQGRELILAPANYLDI